VWSVLAAALHLGNVTFEMGGKNDEGKVMEAPAGYEREGGEVGKVGEGKVGIQRRRGALRVVGFGRGVASRKYHF
jgi:hypothetical protein